VDHEQVMIPTDNENAWEIFPAKIGFDLSEDEDLVDKGLDLLGMGDKPPKSTIEYKEDAEFKEPTPLAAIVSNAQQYAANLNGCIGFSVCPYRGAKFFNEHCYKDGELRDYADWTMYVFSQKMYDDLHKAPPPPSPEPELKSEVVPAKKAPAPKEKKYKMPGLDGRKEHKIALKRMVADDLEELRTVMQIHNRRKDSEDDAKMRNFYREKYKGRYMQPSYPMYEEYGSPGNTMSPSSTMKSASSAPGTPSVRSAGSSAPSSPANWSAHDARSPGRGSTWTYQYGKDQHTHRGPPYLLNNSTSVWQR
jgi:hypothetical protein